jgi:formate dehydrogenase subunit delta
MSSAPLVKMANQIAASVPNRTHAGVETAQHIQRFWTPAMIDELAAFARVNPDDVAPDVRQALDALRPE